MKFLSLAYRFLSNFIVSGAGLLQPQFHGEISSNARSLAILVLVYAAMRAASALRSFYFFQRIERLEIEARRMAGMAGGGARLHRPRASRSSPRSADCVMPAK